jgi:AcrR family transcriptional regulator
MRLTTRDRIVREAMRLFGERGFHATTVADIESAAGLARGAGGLYRHFRSKRALLEEGIRRQIDAGQGLLGLMGDREALADVSLDDQLRAVARAGLRRLHQERDLNRILLRDLRDFPDLLAEVERDEMRRVSGVVAEWLTTRVGQAQDGVDWQAIGAVLIGATSQFWILTDVFGHHPDGVSEDRYVEALVALVGALEKEHR